MSTTGLRLSLFIGEDDTWHHWPLYYEVVRRAREAGLAGATVLRGCEGFGRASLVHTNRLLSMTEDLPAVVVIVDVAERVRAFLPQLDDLVREGAATVDEIEMIQYGRGSG